MLNLRLLTLFFLCLSWSSCDAFSPSHNGRVRYCAKATIETMFGNSAENREIGITGDVELVDLDGPTVVVALKGRFWHTRPMVLSRVGNYIMERIPEVVDVVVSDEAMLLEENNVDGADGQGLSPAQRQAIQDESLPGAPPMSW